MRRRKHAINSLEQHPNLPEILGLLAHLSHIRDEDLPQLAAAWINTVAVAQARDRALSPDSPLVLETLAAFDALSALFDDDLRGEQAYVTVAADVTSTALKAVRDAIAAAYARPILSKRQHSELLRPWRAVYPAATVDEPDLGPRGAEVKALLAMLPTLSTRCHDPLSQQLFETLVTRSFAAEADRAEARSDAFTLAVLTHRRRVWALVRRSACEGLLRSCPTCPTCRPRRLEDRDSERVRTLCLDAACALLVADALPEDLLRLLADPVTSLIPAQRAPSS